MGIEPTINQSENLDKFTITKNQPILLWKVGRARLHVKLNQYTKVQPNHIQMDSIVILSNLEKIGGTRNKSQTVLSKKIWDSLLSKEITVTA